MKYKLYKEINENFDAIKQILFNRNIEEGDMYHYLNTTDEDINKPELLGEDKLYDAATTLSEHIANCNKTLIVVDSDCDGFTSSALLANYLYDLYPNFVKENVNFFFHQGKQHGLEDCIDKILEEKYKLILVPDAGSNDLEQHKILKENNIDIIVLDHHEADIPADYQNAIVINNNNEGDLYPNKFFSGVGITWQFCRYLDKTFGGNNADNYIDLVALGNLGDVMNLRSIETKHIINKGIKDENLKNPFFRGMVNKNSFSIGKNVTGWGIVFYVVPFVNAVQRSGTQEEKELLFKSMLKFEAFKEIPSTKRGCKGEMETILEQALRTCTNVKNRQTRAQEKGMELLEKYIEVNDMMKHKVLLFTLKPGEIDGGLAGLAANKIMGKYQRPVCVLTESADGIYQGSARGYELGGLDDFKALCEETDMTTMTAGHANAFGVAIPKENIEKFLDITDENLKYFNSEPIYLVDYIYNNCDVQPQHILDIASLDYLWGSGMPESQIAIEDLKITSSMVTVYSKKNLTLKISLPNKIDLMLFNANEELCNKLQNNNPGYISVNLVGKCHINEYFGNITPQVFIDELEIIDEAKYCF